MTVSRKTFLFFLVSMGIFFLLLAIFSPVWAGYQIKKAETLEREIFATIIKIEPELKDCEIEDLRLVDGKYIEYRDDVLLRPSETSTVLLKKIKRGEPNGVPETIVAMCLVSCAWFGAALAVQKNPKLQEAMELTT